MYRDERGITLIEILITITIIAVVFSLTASFFKVSEVVFKEGQEQTVEQHAVRITADVLADAVRNAVAIDLFEVSEIGSLSGFDTYYYVNNNQLIKYDGADQFEVTQPDLAENVGAPPGLKFRIFDNGDAYFLEYTVVGLDNYETTSKVMLNNIDSDDMSGVALSGAVVGISKN